MHPANIAKVLKPGDGTPPLSHIMAVVTTAHLGNLAVDGLVTTTLDGRPVIIELIGRPVIIGHR